MPHRAGLGYRLLILSQQYQMQATELVEQSMFGLRNYLGYELW